MNEKIIDYFFKNAEKGNWSDVSIGELSKKLKVKEEKIRKKIPSREYFLVLYNNYLDEKVLREVSNEDLENSQPDEVLQEYLMLKLEFMSKYKLAIANILNSSFTNHNFILLSLKHHKKSIQKFVDKISCQNNLIKKNVLIKLVLGLWLIAFKKWLYEDDNSEAAYSFIDMGIKRIKKNLKVF